MSGRHILVVLAMLLPFSLANADTGASAADQRNMYVSLYTRHYSPDPAHNNDQNMLGLEFDLEGQRLWGLAIFDNSFGQSSQYLYYGKRWRTFESDRWYLKVTGGLLHGYKEPYEDKIPLNGLGVAPAIIPAMGYRRNGFFVEFVQLGLSAGMVNVGRTF